MELTDFVCFGIKFLFLVINYCLIWFSSFYQNLYASFFQKTIVCLCRSNFE